MLHFHAGPVDEEPAATLVQAMRDEIAGLYEGLELDGAQMPKGGPAEMGPPGGTFIVGYDDGVAVCCGGIKRLTENFTANPVASFFGEKRL